MRIYINLFLDSAIRNVEEGLGVQNCLLEKET